MRWSLYFGPSRPRLCPVAPGSLAEQKASRTQLIFLHLRPAQTDTFCESMQTAKTFRLSIFPRGQLISRRRRADIRAVCFRLQDNIQTDTAFCCISIQCLIFFPGRKGDRDEMDLADCLVQSLFWFLEWHLGNTFTDVKWKLMFWSTLKRLHCTLGIDRVTQSYFFRLSETSQTHHDEL